VCPDNFRKIAIKEKQLYLRYFVFLAFVNMAASNLHALQAALSLLPERLGEVCRCAISQNPISVLIGGLLSKNEAGQLYLCPWPPLKQREHCLRLSKILGRHRLDRLICPEALLFISKENHLLTHLADFFESFAILMRAA
jgi:hypothetical protein